jgi:hypothetical protein
LRAPESGRFQTRRQSRRGSRAPAHPAGLAQRVLVEVLPDWRMETVDIFALFSAG